MQPPTTPEADRSPEVAPPIRHVVPWRVVAVKARADMRLQVEFVDGTKGEVDLGPVLRSAQVGGTLFEPLIDPEFFAQARVVLGAVEWPNGADLAPDAMYDEIREHGRWVVS